MSAHLLAVVSAHGFGHFAQTALVLNALHELNPGLRITLRSRLPRELIRTRLRMPVDIVEDSADFGMLMDSALDVRLEDSFEAYRHLHRDWARQVAGEVEKLRNIGPDRVLANIPYLTLAAAAEAGIPAFAFCSLNWADIFWDYFSGRSGAQAIHEQMLTAYDSAETFFCPEPSMPMPLLHNCLRVGSVAALGQERRMHLERRFGLTGKRLVLVVPGGIHTDIDMERWPCHPDLCWVPAWPVDSRRDDILPAVATGLEFTDLLTSCDLVLTKPGYGIVTEAVCNGKPVLFVRRGDWAEEPFLVDWLLRHGRAVEVSRQQFFNGQVIDELEALLGEPPSAPPLADGAMEIARHLQRALA